jgi:hypothetical protein
MSSLLEQAIVDAKALKEAALKNAEHAIIEKYAPDIKEAVQKLLEQDELGLEDEEEADFPPEMLDADEPEEEPYIPPAATDGERLCPCPEDEQEIEIDFDDLRAAVMEGEKALGIELVTEAAKSDGVGVDAMDQDSEAEELAAEQGEQTQKDPIEEQVEITDELIDDLLEALSVDIDPSKLKTGWLNQPQSQVDHATEMTLAALQDDKRKEELQAMQKAVKELQESNENLTSKHDALITHNGKLVETINVLKEKFDEMSVINSRLLYTNRILKDDSLNERQKNKVVEALSKCGTINEAKVIYETLQSAVSGKDKSAMPQSLREAVGRNSRSSTIIPTRRGSQRRELSFADRMKTLAGIDNKK